MVASGSMKEACNYAKSGIPQELRRQIYELILVEEENTDVVCVYL